MNANDPNVSLVELVADALGTLTNELVLVGGCAVGLLITDAGRPTIRETQDVDMVAEVVTLPGYYRLEEELRKKGFQEQPDIICRWAKEGLLVDVMAARDIGHNFTNEWYEAAVRNSQQYKLPSGNEIRLITAPYFLATKLVSFNNRGRGDYEHHDMEDIINLVDGRVELVQEVLDSDSDVQEYIMDEIEALLSDQTFIEKLPWQLHPDVNNQGRVDLIIQRLRKLAGL
jgi:hypothetical protein